VFTPFLAVFLLVASGFAGGVLALSWLLRKGDPPVPAPSELGRAIGLTPEDTHEAHGERDGIEVHAKWTSVRRTVGQGRRVVQVMRYWAVIEPALDVGLEVGRSGVLDGFVGTLGASEDVASGDDELDATLRFGARDASQVQALLRDPDVKRALLEGARRGALGVVDGHVALGHDGWAGSPEALRASVDAVRDLARALGAAQARAHAA
jgi:hypothetical protein